MSAPTPTPQITPADRLGLTLCLAVILHAIVILGVTFAPTDDPKSRYEPMDILLVQQESEEPEEADYLAQANLEGGGESEEPERPSTPLPPPLPKPVAEVTAPAPVQPAPPPAEPEPLPEQPDPEPEPPPPEVAEVEPAPEPAETPEQVAVQTPEPAPVEAPEPPPEKPEQPAETEPEPEPRPETEPKPEAETEAAEQPAEEKPSGAELISSSMKAAALSAEIQRKLKAKAERPRRTFISASTKEYKYASYMEAWRTKVERVGNLNYPEEARQRGLTGSLILDVALNPDGSVEQITIRRSSGNKILDDAAIRIVKLAAPFAPFPDNIRTETDILHITRTWQFMQGNRFQ